MLVAFRFNQIAIQLMPTEFLVKIFAPHVFAYDIQYEDWMYNTL